MRPNGTFFLLSISVLGWCATAGCAADHTTDTLETVKKNLSDKKGVLLDVRETEEWKSGHLKDAQHLALSKIQTGITAAEFAKLAPKGTIVYLHCAAGVRCLKAANALKELGYDLRPLKPGFKDLREAGFPKAD